MATRKTTATKVASPIRLVETRKDRRPSVTATPKSSQDVPTVWQHPTPHLKMASDLGIAASYSRREVVSACLITGLSIGLVEAFVWIGSLLARP